MSLFNRVGNLISGQILAAKNQDSEAEKPAQTATPSADFAAEFAAPATDTDAFEQEFHSAEDANDTDDPFVENVRVSENDFSHRHGAMMPETMPKTADLPIANNGELEEWSEPLPVAELLEPLAIGDTIEAPDDATGSWRIESLLSQQPALNWYHARDIASENEVRLRQAQGERAASLRREAQWRGEIESPMLPRVLGVFEHDEQTFCVEEIPSSETTLVQLLQNPHDWNDVLHILTQVAALMVRLHAAGWSHGGLRPEIIALSKPIQITDFSFALPFGETPSSVQAPAGYAAPESFERAPTAPSLDIYALGALLYRALNGAPLPESGADLRAWQPQRLVAGVPQILARCLGAPDSRYETMEALHRDLLRLKNSLQPRLQAEIVGASSVGLEPSRVTNQDAWGHLTGAWQNNEGTLRWSVAGVADGMGGMAAGEIASEIAISTLLECTHQHGRAWQNSPLPTVNEQAEALNNWTREANARVCAAMNERGVRGGCTLVAVSVFNERLCLAHIGDCRCYLWRNGEYELLSRDHSFVMSLVLQGEIGLDEVRTHADRSKITRSLGDRHPLPDYFVDGLDIVTGKPVLELQADDVILLCSDGLWEPVEESEMARALENVSLQKAAQSLIESALRAGAPDNATVVLLRMNQARESAVQVLAEGKSV